MADDKKSSKPVVVKEQSKTRSRSISTAKDRPPNILLEKEKRKFGEVNKIAAEAPPPVRPKKGAKT